ncbi:MAG: Stenotrophomonas phage, partial [Pseudomonadota bacterium]
CWPCIYARKSEIRLIADIDPDRITRLRVLEAQVTDTASARAKAKGETLKMNPAFFQAKTGGGGEAWPIDRVVDWSRTSRGGVQVELFAADPRDAGCMRWGLCDTNGRSE